MNHKGGHQPDPSERATAPPPRPSDARRSVVAPSNCGVRLSEKWPHKPTGPDPRLENVTEPGADPVAGETWRSFLDGLAFGFGVAIALSVSGVLIASIVALFVT